MFTVLHAHAVVDQRQRKMAQHAKARCGKTGKPFLHSWNCPGCNPQSLPALRGETSSGAPCRSRRQLPPTRQFPPRASQRLTMCQRLLSTPCSLNQAYRHNRQLHEDVRDTMPKPTASYASAKTRSSVCHNVTRLLLGGHVNWHFAVGWPREDVVADRVLRSRAVSASRSHQYQGYKPHQYPSSSCTQSLKSVSCGVELSRSHQFHGYKPHQ